MRPFSITALALALAALAGCTPEYQEYAAKAEQCRAAKTYGEAYGTPDNRGPCWGATTGTSVIAGYRGYTVRRTGTEHGIAILTYDGNTLVGVTEG